MDDQQRNDIRRELVAIASRKYKTLKEIDTTNLDYNPYLLRLLNLNTPEEIATFMVNQRVERSVVTSYGFRIQNIARALSERGTGVEGADICKEVGGKRYYIQIKAGPNTPNKDITSTINTLLKSAMRRNQGSVALLGMTYGTREQVSGIIQSYSHIDWIIGREFWGFISGDKNAYSEIFRMVKDISDHYRPNPDDLQFQELLRVKIDSIACQIRLKYGDGGDEMWSKLLEDNM